MKKLYESEFIPHGDSAENITVYALDDNEFWELDEMTHQELCERLGVCDESGYYVTPGALYNSYYFDLTCNFLTVVCTSAYNI